ncbi:hypothetical protein A3758_30035 [Oleiphilus sp. HI0118]|nr:hypothetical protein A3758_30035 [Oleiphilus sp. HI0118]
MQGQPVRILPAENSGLHRVYAPKQAVEDLVGPILNIAKPSALGEEWLFAGVVEVNDGEAKPKRLLNFMAES